MSAEVLPSAPLIPAPERVSRASVELANRHQLPAYLYDTGHLTQHLADIRSAFVQEGSGAIEVLYAVKANPDAGVLRTLSGLVDGFEVSSGGEITHVRSLFPQARLIFGGPGKTDSELTLALAAGVERYHVESVEELRRLDILAGSVGVVAEVLLRVNIPAGAGTGAGSSAALTMGGVPSPFGMDPAEASRAAELINGRGQSRLTSIRVRGIHAHLASGVDSVTAADEASHIADWAREFGSAHGLEFSEVNVGGGMTVDYAQPTQLFDWANYAARMSEVLARYPEFSFQIEPGRSLTAYSGWYVTRIQELKQNHGAWFAICSGGTHHLRTPAAKGHDQPVSLVPVRDWERPWARTILHDTAVSFVGQLCTPKDVLARQVPLPEISSGDIVLFAMAGAYAFNISHQEFLMHPKPEIVYL